MSMRRKIITQNILSLKPVDYYWNLPWNLPWVRLQIDPTHQKISTRTSDLVQLEANFSSEPGTDQHQLKWPSYPSGHRPLDAPLGPKWPMGIIPSPYLQMALKITNDLGVHSF